MPYDPGVSYHGGELLAQGISQFGSSIGNAILEAQKKHSEIQKQLTESGVLMDWADKHGYVSDEQRMKYAGANSKQKADMADTLAKTISLDQAQNLHEEDLANRLKVAQIQASVAGAGAYAGLSPRSGAPYGQNVGDVLYHPETGAAIGTMGERGPVFFPSAASEEGQFIPPPKTTQVTDSQGRIIDVIPTSKKQVAVSPFTTVETKAPVHQPGETYFDPQTGEVRGVWGAGDHPVILPEGDPFKKEVAARLKAARTGGATPTPTPSPGLMQRIFGGGATPTPAPIVAPTPAYTPPAMPAAPAVPAFGLQVPGTPNVLAPPPNAAPGGGGRMVTVNGQPADYDALPSGTPYTAPDGSQRKKP